MTSVQTDPPKKDQQATEYAVIKFADMSEAMQ